MEATFLALILQNSNLGFFIQFPYNNSTCYPVSSKCYTYHAVIGNFCFGSFLEPDTCRLVPLLKHLLTM